MKPTPLALLEFLSSKVHISSTSARISILVTNKKKLSLGFYYKIFDNFISPALKEITYSVKGDVTIIIIIKYVT